jgi:hypothetical protein
VPDDTCSPPDTHRRAEARNQARRGASSAARQIISNAGTRPNDTGTAAAGLAVAMRPEDAFRFLEILTLRSDEE